jgi:hypothetical protein
MALGHAVPSHLFCPLTKAGPFLCGPAWSTVPAIQGSVSINFFPYFHICDVPYMIKTNPIYMYYVVQDA